MEEIVQIKVRLRHMDGKDPITDPAYSVKYYDNDMLEDDYLGEATLDNNGYAVLSITESDYQSLDSPWEKYPDIYFKVYKNDQEIFTSPVYQNLNFDETAAFSLEKGIRCDLGTFFLENT